MIIKIELADGTFEMFHSDNYRVSKPKDFHPAINSVEVYSEGKRIFKKGRKFKFFYKHVTFKSKAVQDLLKTLSNRSEQTENK